MTPDSPTLDDTPFAKLMTVRLLKNTSVPSSSLTVGWVPFGDALAPPNVRPLSPL